MYVYCCVQKYFCSYNRLLEGLTSKISSLWLKSANNNGLISWESYNNTTAVKHFYNWQLEQNNNWYNKTKRRRARETDFVLRESVVPFLYSIIGSIVSHCGWFDQYQSTPPPSTSPLPAILFIPHQALHSKYSFSSVKFRFRAVLHLASRPVSRSTPSETLKRNYLFSFGFVGKSDNHVAYKVACF